MRGFQPTHENSRNLLTNNDYNIECLLLAYYTHII
jgi:hypothetical protein